MNDQQLPSVTFEKLCGVISQEVRSFSNIIEIVSNIPPESVFIAGGTVRDAFLQPERKIKDLDVFLTDVAFEQLEAYLMSEGTLQRNQFGTYRWFGRDDGDVYYDIIIIENFYNGLWNCRNITDVLNQFDITVNAVAFDLSNGTFYDPENGLLDINAKILRAVRFDYPEIVVSESIPLSRNTVLWCRYHHYSKTLGLSLDEITRQWMIQNDYRKVEIPTFTQYFFEPEVDHV
ncbi:hypothetical protein IDJ77_16195 [Mucilaginibacter sp. ZT4R22]|uniref:Poly A polymerase head domain-containing protein n=1 Tax=Mucilaginibacter pankratovii TaxID=2772110 RepID=A0ABR7WST0_9SPHI|nr:hypothetical protein [Mucilaginibacter pankratovii]MBD1365356.1 hypothetical protein [Mucilaginibacter pankratovii]